MTDINDLIDELQYVVDDDRNRVWQLFADIRASVKSRDATVKRIYHFATGACSMKDDIRLRCIAKECEASMTAKGAAK